MEDNSLNKNNKKNRTIKTLIYMKSVDTETMIMDFTMQNNQQWYYNTYTFLIISNYYEIYYTKKGLQPFFSLLVK